MILKFPFRVSVAVLFVAAGRSSAVTQPASTPPLGPSDQLTFNSPAQATNELVRAAQTHDRQAMSRIFGPEVTNLLTGDAALDQKHFASFGRDLTEHCAMLPGGEDRLTLEIGQEHWPFPIPLVETNGSWFFDTIAGEDEIINRHIGRDEFYAIGVCRAYVKAQREHAERNAGPNGPGRYAVKFRCTPGMSDGLCQPTQNGGLPAPIAQACRESFEQDRGGNEAKPFHGYFFKILTRQGSAAAGGKKNYLEGGELTGGFALVAYPVRWGEAGIMTFIVNRDGVVYQRSLGEKTFSIAERMKEYNPDSHWTVVQDPGVADLAADNEPETGRK